jgi:pimeloyl-ACP methyl ester carboxylesterase
MGMPNTDQEGRAVVLEVIDKGSATKAHPVPLLFVHGACSSAWCWDERFLSFFADYVDDVHAVALKLGPDPVLIGHSMGCWVVLNYLASRPSPAAVLMAPATPQGIRRLTFRIIRRHPWVALRVNTFGNQADLFKTLALAREFLFCASTQIPS